MNHSNRAITSMMLALTFCASAAPSALADDGQSVAERVNGSSDPQATYSALKPTERQEYWHEGEMGSVEQVTDSDSRPLVMRTAAYTGCFEKTSAWVMKSLAKVTLFNYGQTTKVCAKSGKVTSVTIVDDYAESKFLGWRAEPVKDSDRKTRNMGWEGRSKVQFHFHFGGGGYTDIQNPDPCAQVRLNANGHDHVESGSCSLG